MKRFVLLGALSAAAIAVHLSCAASFIEVDLVEELLVHRGAGPATMAAALVVARCFLLVVAPAWLAVASSAELAAWLRRRGRT
jgi:hypothetical protein